MKVAAVHVSLHIWIRLDCMEGQGGRLLARHPDAEETEVQRRLCMLRHGPCRCHRHLAKALTLSHMAMLHIGA